MDSRTLAVVAAWSLVACTRQVVPQTPQNTAPRAIKLLADTPERETERLKDKREDVEVEASEGERTPHIVATGETPVLKREGQRARLYGDAQGTKGFAVDNFLLLEVTDGRGKVVRRAAVGFTEGVLMGKEQVDSLGRRAFTFEPGEVDVTALLPDSEPFQLRATALDYWGVGRVSDLYLVLTPDSRASGDDDLRGQ